MQERKISVLSLHTSDSMTWIPYHTHPHPAKKGHTHSHPPTPSKKMAILTHIHPHPAKDHTQPKNGHTEPHLTSPSTHTHPHPVKKGSHPPTHNWKKECQVSKTYYILQKYSLFIILAGVFIFEKDYVYEYFLYFE